MKRTRLLALALLCALLLYALTLQPLWTPDSFGWWWR